MKKKTHKHWNLYSFEYCCYYDDHKKDHSTNLYFKAIKHCTDTMQTLEKTETGKPWKTEKSENHES